MKNPLLKKLNIPVSSGFASITGIIQKEILLILIVIISALTVLTLNLNTPIILINSTILGIILIFAANKYPKQAAPIAILFAITEGIVLSSASLILNTLYPGIVIQAIILTMVVALITAIIYSTNIITINNTFKHIVFILLLTILGCYGIEIIMKFFFDYTFITFNIGIIGILIDIGILILAIACLLIDYSEISEIVYNNVDKSVEWFYAQSLLITLVLMYVRILEVLQDIE